MKNGIIDVYIDIVCSEFFGTVLTEVSNNFWKTFTDLGPNFASKIPVGKQNADPFSQQIVSSILTDFNEFEKHLQWNPHIYLLPFWKKIENTT